MTTELSVYLEGYHKLHSYYDIRNFTLKTYIETIFLVKIIGINYIEAY